jgi:hypothetical protein
MNEAYELLGRAIALLSLERKRIDAEIKNSPDNTKANDAEVMARAMSSISDIKRIDRIKSMLTDARSMFEEDKQ